MATTHRIEVGPDRPWLIILGTVVNTAVAVWVTSLAVAEASLLFAALALVVWSFSAFGGMVARMHLTGPHHVVLEPGGRVTYPVGLGARTATLELSEVTLLHRTDDALQLTLGPDQPMVAWTRVFYGREALRTLGEGISHWLDRQEQDADPSEA